MNEITRIHIAKIAYDIEIAAKKQLEKYIKSLEVYTQDAEVFQDVELRITELLAERGVKAGGVISSDDVAAIRSQLGEPYEFADGESDIAVGATIEPSRRRFYRSTDTAVLGGVLSGFAQYFNVNPVWTRLIFVLLLFISFGFASLVYILLWIILPPARTATEKLQLAGKDVTLESIRELNADEEKAPENRVAPLLQRIFTIGFGAISGLAAVGVFGLTVWLVVAAASANQGFVDMTNGFTGLGDGNAWIAWLVYGIVVFGMLLLTALLGLISYAFFARKVTRRIVVSGIIIVVLGIASVATALGIATTQSWRVANETRSMVRETKANLPTGFATVTSLKLSVKAINTNKEANDFFSEYASIRYVVDNGPVRYELSALPSAKVVSTIEDGRGEIRLEVPRSYRNSFVQPLLTVYGPALQTVIANTDDGGARLSYSGTTQPELTIETLHEYSNINVAGSYEKVLVKGTGYVELGESTVRALTVDSQQDLSVSAGTVRDLTVTQPDICPSGSQAESTSVRVYGVTSGTILYNGQSLPVASHQTGCASVIVEPADEDSF